MIVALTEGTMTSNGEISFEHAIELTENALSEINRLAIEQLRRGAETSPHIEAAERDLRSTLRQLVLAEREPTHHAQPEQPRLPSGESS